MSCDKCNGQHLSAVPLGVALGSVWGLGLVFLGLINICCSWGLPVLTLLSSMYIGYEATVIGSLIGGAWGFLDGFVCGVLIALIYRCSYKCCCACCKKFCSSQKEIN